MEITGWPSSLRTTIWRNSTGKSQPNVALPVLMRPLSLGRRNLQHRIAEAGPCQQAGAKYDRREQH